MASTQWVEIDYRTKAGYHGSTGAYLQVVNGRVKKDAIRAALRALGIVNAIKVRLTR